MSMQTIHKSIYHFRFKSSSGWDPPWWDNAQGCHSPTKFLIMSLREYDFKLITLLNNQQIDLRPLTPSDWIHQQKNQYNLIQVCLFLLESCHLTCFPSDADPEAMKADVICQRCTCNYGFQELILGYVWVQ